MIAEADAEAEENTADDEHGDVLGGGVDDGAGEEADGAADDAGPPPLVPGDVGGAEGGDERRQVERGSEESEDLVVVFAVIRLLEVSLLPSVYLRKEFLQEIIHGSHPSCNFQIQIQNQNPPFRSSMKNSLNRNNKRERITRNAKIITEERTSHGADNASENEIGSDSVLVEMSPSSAIGIQYSSTRHLTLFSLSLSQTGTYMDQDSRFKLITKMVNR